MPFNGRLYDPERDAATTEAEAHSSAAVLEHSQPEALTPDDLTAALAAEIDSPELADTASLLIGQARALERHYPAAVPIPLPVVPRATSAPAKRRPVAALGALTLAAALALVGVGTLSQGTSRNPSTTAPHAPAPAVTAVIAPVGGVEADVAATGRSEVSLTARRDLAAPQMSPDEQRRLESLLEMEGCAREGLTDLEESGELPPVVFTF